MTPSHTHSGPGNGAAASPLLGLCWDHPRCTSPMAAAGAQWARRNPGSVIRWESRPLAAFNDQPIAEAVRGYDLVFVDHPAIAEAVATGCLTALDTLLDAAVLDALAADSIAGSHLTYRAEGHQWALAVDAACQVAVADARWLDHYGPQLATWDQVLKLAKAAPGSVALPLYPSDAIISLLSISVGEARAAGAAPPSELFTSTAVELLAELAALADPRSFDLNPPGLLELMAGPEEGTPLYAPLVFGYSDYQRPTAPGRPLRFCDAPTVDGRPGGTVLGGAGLAVPADGRHPRQAAEFAAWIAGPKAQRHIVAPGGGQPASAIVWADPAADRLLGGFLSGTRRTTEAAWVRPATRWWPRFQEAAGQCLARLLRQAAPPARIHRELVRIRDTYTYADAYRDAYGEVQERP